MIDPPSWSTRLVAVRVQLPAPASAFVPFASLECLESPGPSRVCQPLADAHGLRPSGPNSCAAAHKVDGPQAAPRPGDMYVIAHFTQVVDMISSGIVIWVTDNGMIKRLAGMDIILKQGIEQGIQAAQAPIPAVQSSEDQCCRGCQGQLKGPVTEALPF